MKKDAGSTELIQLAYKMRKDPALCAEIGRDPLAYLKSIGVEVEDEFCSTVEKHLKALTAGSERNDAPQPPEGSFVFTTNAWGLVLVINEEGMRWLKTASVTMIGDAIMAALLVLAATTTNPVVGALVLIGALWCGIQAGWLLAELAAVLILDEVHHKGVYLTWTWVGLALTCYVPIPAPIT